MVHPSLFDSTHLSAIYDHRPCPRFALKMKTLLTTASCLAICLFAPLTGLAQAQPQALQLLAHPLRLSSDLKADDSRKPLEFLRFTKVKAGDQVLDLATGGGYSAQVLALASQPGGHVWAQNEKPSTALAARLNEHPQPYFEPIIKPFENPIPENAPPLDLVTIVLSYHDLAFMPFDRSLMNQRIFKALKSGGHYVLIDHAAQSGTGLQNIKTIHRIDEQVVLNEILAAGFQLEAESGDWRNPNDPRVEMFSKMSQRDDRFALRFIKP